MKNQEICYINKEKFELLFDDENSNLLKGYDCDNHEQLIYVDDNWHIELDSFDQKKAENAAHIIVSDDFPLEKHYIPNRKFEFLIHSGTLRNFRVSPFEEKFKKLFCGVVQTKEHRGTKYGEIVQNIVKNNQKH